jgi:uncharacterized membrane protein YdbT with pleckstrin-like domain
MDLRSGENVIFEGHPSWRAILGFYFKWVLAGALAGGIAALVTAIGGGVDAGVVSISVAAFVAVGIIVGLIKRVATTYSISNQRLHIKRGIVSRHIQQTRIERVQNVNITQSVLHRILQVGKVDFDTAGTDDADFSFDGVSQPEKVMKAVEQAQHEASLAGAQDGLGGPHPTQAAPPPPQQPGA